MTVSPVPLHDLAIVGGGLFGTLLALGLRRHRPDVDFVLVEGGARFGGSLLEGAVAQEVPAALADVIDRATVRVWPGCFVNYPGRSQFFGDDILLVDPRQLHIEVIDHPLASRCRAGVRIRAIDGGRIFHDGGDIRARLIVDASDARIQSQLGIERVTRYRDFSLAHDLELPILADMSATAGDWSFLQLYPVDGERMVVEHFRPRAPAPGAASAVDGAADGAAPGGGALVSLATPGRAGTVLPGPSVAAAHFPSLLQAAAEVAAGFAALDLDEAGVRSFFAERMAQGRDRSRRMFELVALCRGGRQGSGDGARSI